MPATTADQPVQGPSLEDAARHIEGLLDLEEGNPDDQREQAEEAPAHVSSDTDEGVVAEAEAQETTAQADGAEDEAAETDSDAEATDAKEPQMVTVKIDGKPVTVTLEEALNGYQRFSDYSRKTASLANDRRELSEQAKAVADERQQYATMLVALRNQLQSEQEAEPNWDDVFKADPVGYARKRDEWRDKQDKLAAANFELQRLARVQQEENAKAVAKMTSDNRAKMLDQMPAWKDSKVWEADRKALVEYALASGYSPEEISQAYDHRALIWGHKARLYDALMANKPKPAAARGPKPATAGTAPTQSNLTKLNAAQQRLAKSGSITDAAKVFEQLI